MSTDDLDLVDDEPEHIDHTFLTFYVGGEEYAVPVANVTEIVRLQKTYVVPDVPGYIRGVINLRGKVIPLLDVRNRFGLADAAYTDRTVIVVLELGDTTTGLVVDAVSEVTEILPDQIEIRPALRNATRPSMVRGMGKRANRVSFILDVAALLAADGAPTPPISAAPTAR
ncbi:MAG: chemotaxis protein CheW [Deltaproteobacteria bacterium]|nr:chemotaxis protein CheW [Deltaproteobacteria bacterium]